MGVGSSAQIAHDPLQTAADFLPTDVEVIVNKIYCHFHIYTAREERLQEFCKVQSRLLLNRGSVLRSRLMRATEGVLHAPRPHISLRVGSTCPRQPQPFLL